MRSLMVVEFEIVQLRRDDVESFLQRLDRIEDCFAKLEFSGLEAGTQLLFCDTLVVTPAPI